MKEFYFDLGTFQALRCELDGFFPLKGRRRICQSYRSFKSDKFKLNGCISGKDDCKWRLDTASYPILCFIWSRKLQKQRIKLKLIEVYFFLQLRLGFVLSSKGIMKESVLPGE